MEWEVPEGWDGVSFISGAPEPNEVPRTWQGSVRRVLWGWTHERKERKMLSQGELQDFQSRYTYVLLLASSLPQAMVYSSGKDWGWERWNEQESDAEPNTGLVLKRPGFWLWLSCEVLWETLSQSVGLAGEKLITLSLIQL